MRALCLGICDKIVPGLLIGALAFGHLPMIFVPGGPMTSGVSEPGEVAHPPAVRARARSGAIELLESEAASYHGAGTCTFYGTANSNQMLMEVMGLHLPGAAFVPPNTPLRDALTRAAAQRAAAITALRVTTGRLPQVIDERAIVNAIVGAAGHRRFHQSHHPPGGDGAVRPASASTGMTSATCPPSCRCWRASIPTAGPT